MQNIIVFSHLYKPHLGGLEKYVENFYKHLSSEYRVTVITSRYLNSLPEEDKDGSIKVFRVPSLEVVKGKYYVPTITGYLKILNLVRKNLSFDTQIHTHTRFYLTNALGVFFANKYKLKVYHFEHGSSFVKDGGIVIRAFALLFDKTIANYILKSSCKVFPISKGVKSFLSRNYKEIHYGSTLYNSYNFKRNIFKLRPHPKILKLLFVGRLVKSKGVEELIKACDLLKKDGISFSLTIVGDGSERENLCELIKSKNLQSLISMKGALPYEITQKEYLKHDILINPSYTEGLPTTVLEALGNNLLVIATDVGGTREIIPYKYLLNTTDLNPSGIYKQIITIEKNWKLYQKEFADIYLKVRNKFSWERNVSLFKENIEN